MRKSSADSGAGSAYLLHGMFGKEETAAMLDVDFQHEIRPLAVLP